MKSILVVGLLMLSSFADAQEEKMLRSFPITDYIVGETDSIKIVQVYLPDEKIIKEKQVGILYGKYETNMSDTGLIGTGKCHLIKGDYYYFGIKCNTKQPKAGDLIYMMVPATSVHKDKLQDIAARSITLTDVYDNHFFKPFMVFNDWTLIDEVVTMDSMINDVRFTGKYFKQQDSSMNQVITKGPYAGKKLLDLMMVAQTADLEEFFNYMIARPALYAGRTWKLSEVYATWLSEGAPMVKRE